jgi:DHA1 family bicyclomycin/chloramphenicol resistance-like MFS transporter
VLFFIAGKAKGRSEFFAKTRTDPENFSGVITHPQFYTYALTAAISAAGLYAYIGGSPHVYHEIFHVTAKQYGWIFALIAMGLIGASQVNSLL